MGQINFMFSVILDKYILRPSLLYPAASVQCYVSKRVHPVAAAVVRSNTHTHTHLFATTDGVQSAPLSLCLDTVQLVSCWISPHHPYLTRQAGWEHILL